MTLFEKSYFLFTRLNNENNNRRLITLCNILLKILQTPCRLYIIFVFNFLHAFSCISPGWSAAIRNRLFTWSTSALLTSQSECHEISLGNLNDCYCHFLLSCVSFVRFHLPEPIYINIVRDPVERVISWYYYVRAPWYYVERKQIFPDLPLPDPNWLKKDFESCVLKGDRECRYLQGEIHEGIGDHRRQTLFFCGHSEKCT